MEGKKVTHFSHPEHSLIKAEAPNSFICDGCKTEGSKQMFWCPKCEFKLHLLCATCPKSLTFFMHPQHRLAMVSLGGTTRSCGVCHDEVLGITYRCAPCEFDAHPVCALLPPTVADGAHPDHTLTFIQSDPSPCTICGSECKGGRYRCGLCHVDLHPECLRGTNVSRSVSGEVPRVRKRDLALGFLLRTAALASLESLDFSNVLDDLVDLGGDFL